MFLCFDVGDTILLHVFAAVFGMSASRVLHSDNTSNTSDTSDTSDTSELSSGERDQEGSWGWVVVAASFYCVAIVGGVSSFSYIGGSLDFWATL